MKQVKDSVYVYVKNGVYNRTSKKIYPSASIKSIVMGITWFETTRTIINRMRDADIRY